MDYATLIKRNRGVVSTAALKQTGADKDSIDEAIACGALRRERWGWYSTPDADAEVVAAVSAGGVVSCVAALRMHGVWVPDESRHMRVSRHRRRSGPQGCRCHGRPRPLRGSIDDVATAVTYAACCLTAENFIVVCDSILNKRLLTRRQLFAALRDAPRSIQQLLAQCDGSAESGTETMVRLRLRSLRIRVSVQHRVRGVGRVDLLIGRRLVIEVDSRAHHTGEQRYEADRRRDRRLIARSYVVVRLTYAQVVDTWPESIEDILIMVRKRMHL